MPQISPLAVVSPDAQIGSNVEIGPFCLIESNVIIKDGCRLDSHVVIRSGVTVGENNHFYAGSVIGGLPQHITAEPPFGQICIGDGNIFREHSTVHRSLHESGATIIGNENYFMVNAHVAHDCVVGNSNVLVNNVMLGGHVTVGNRVNIGGGAGIHQNCRVGSLAMVGAQARVVQDVPPFMMVDGPTNRIVGLNLVGLRRSGRMTEEIRTLKAAYFTLYRCGKTWKEILEVFQDSYSIGAAAELTQFLLTVTNRGIVRERAVSRPPFRVVESENNEENITLPTIRVNVG